DQDGTGDHRPFEARWIDNWDTLQGFTGGWSGNRRRHSQQKTQGGRDKKTQVAKHRCTLRGSQRSVCQTEA
ncbi:MAG: hypothetical protein WBR56_06815, partial [Sedimenticolaceae bacterium]